MALEHFRLSTNWTLTVADFDPALF